MIIFASSGVEFDVQSEGRGMRGTESVRDARLCSTDSEGSKIVGWMEFQKHARATNLT